MRDYLGSRIDNADLPTLAQNRFRFNGKEKLIAGANDTKLTDYGARMYSAPLARWTTPDPLADKYYSTSPYAFCNNNPVNFVDPDGKVVGTVIDIISVGVGVYNLVTNLNQGNTQAALDDLAGIGLDLVSAFVPGVTVAAGATKTLAKSAPHFADDVINSAGSWNLKPFDRGYKLESILGGRCNNFPTIDKFDKGTGTVTSIKSLDLNAKSYQSGNSVFNKVKSYIDKLAAFSDEKDVLGGEIKHKALELAIPEGATKGQIKQLEQLRDYAQKQNIQLSIFIAK